MSCKKWLSIWVVAFIVMTAVAALFNYKVDSLGLVTDDGYLDKAAQDVASGKIVAGLKNFDERIFAKKVINRLDACPELVAIGSSRLMQLRKRTFSGDSGSSFHNYSVSGASLEDYLALISVHLNKCNELPKNIILGTDPWIFNINNDQDRFKSLLSDYLQMLSRLDFQPNLEYSRPQYYKKLFSVEYTIQNFLFLKNNYSNGFKGYRIVDNTEVDERLVEPDGSIQYPYGSRFPDSEVVQRLAVSYTKGDVYSLRGFSEISNAKLFEKFIAYLVTNGSNVTLYLPPYHPYVYGYLIDHEEYKIVGEVESFLKDISKRYKVNIVGSYDPHVLGVTKKDFFDGSHALDSVYNKMFNEMNVIE